MTRGEMQDQLSKFCAGNPEYREALISDPKELIAKQFNNEIPDSMDVKAVVETADTSYIIVPHVAAEGELDDADLESVAGGFADKYEANCSGGGSGAFVTLNQISL